MSAYIDESGTRNVEIPADDSEFAMSRPEYLIANVQINPYET